MSPGSNRLEVTICLADRTQHRYFEDDPQDIARILHNFNPARAFQQKQLIIAGTYFMAGFNTASICRIEMVSESLPDFPHLGELKEVEEITEKELTFRTLPKWSDPRRVEVQTKPGDLVETFAEFATIDGKRLCARLTARAGGRLDQRQQSQNILNANAFHVRRRRHDGIIIINPANIVRWAFYPGLPEAPLNSWPMHRMDLTEDSGPASIMMEKLTKEQLEGDTISDA